jgi:thioredoxin 1
MLKYASILILLALTFVACKKENLVDTSENTITDVSAEDSFDAELAEGVTVVFYHASWCSNCKAQRPAFEAASENSSIKDAVFLELEYEDFESITKKYDVPGFPTIVIYKDGEEKNRFTGKGHSEQQIVDSVSSFLD